MIGHRGLTAASIVLPAYLGVTIVLFSLFILGAGATADSPPGPVLCGAGGTSAAINGVALKAAQLANAETIVSVTAQRRLPSYAAIIAVTTAYTEAKLVNSAVETDHDSEGLFQQRVSLYSRRVADDPIRSTAAFLTRLTRVGGWQHGTVADDAQSVQRSGYPERYAANASLGAALTALFWPTAVQAAEAGRTGPTSTRPICTGDQPGPPSAAGDLVAGTPTVPAGLIIEGSKRARIAVRFVLAQLGKPYQFGAAGPSAYDCSGLTMAGWAAAGIPLEHLAAAQASAGTPEPTDLSQARSGDLVLIPGADGTPARPGHVGMIVGRVHGQLYLAQAPGYRDLPVELTEARQWAGDVVAVRHIA